MMISRDSAKKLNPVDLWDLLSNPEPAVDWLFEPVMLRGMVHHLYGDPAAGKTFFSWACIKHIVGQVGKVMVIDEDGGETRTSRYLKTVSFTKAELESVFYYPFPNLLDHEDEELLSEVERTRPDLVVFDTTADMLAIAGKNEDSAGDVTDWMRRFAQAITLTEGKPAVLLIDHKVKAARSTGYARGSGAKKAKVDVAWLIDQYKPLRSGQVGGVRLTCEKDRFGVLPTVVRFRLGSEGLGFVFEKDEGPETPRSLADDSDARLAVLHRLKECGTTGATRSELESAAGLARSRTTDLLKLLRSEGLVESFGSNRNIKYRSTTDSVGDGRSVCEPGPKSSPTDPALPIGEAGR